MDEMLAAIMLQPRLRDVVHAPFVRKAGCLLLAPLAANATGQEAFQDRTAYEAFINKFHVDDFIDEVGATNQERLRILVQQGGKSAVELATRLAAEGKYRVLLSLDADLPTIALRFFERREGEPWGAENPDEYQLEEVLMLDT